MYSLPCEKVRERQECHHARNQIGGHVPRLRPVVLELAHPLDEDRLLLARLRVERILPQAPIVAVNGLLQPARDRPKQPPEPQVRR